MKRGNSVTFDIQVSLWVLYCKRDKYTSQDFCDKTMDGKWPYIAKVVFRIVQNHGD